jgi:hypothetical protein
MSKDHVCGACGSDKPFKDNPADPGDVICSECSAPDLLIVTREEFFGTREDTTEDD